MSSEQEISSKVFHLNIDEKLYEQRNSFCPNKNHWTCDPKCPIFTRFLMCGLSCTQALHLYPQECREIMAANGTKKQEENNDWKNLASVRNQGICKCF